MKGQISVTLGISLILTKEPLLSDIPCFEKGEQEEKKKRRSIQEILLNSFREIITKRHRHYFGCPEKQLWGGGGLRAERK